MRGDFMPAYYTHYRLGKQALPEFPAQVRQSIQRFRRLYDMGLQGPDFFFYHNPFFPTATGELGHTFHMQTGQEFFTRVCAQANSEAAKVYLYGLLGHYLLDSLCHPFVHKMNDSGEAGHVALEAEFERYLLDADGLRPVYCQDFSKRMKLTRGECVTVAGFYPPATPGGVWQSVRFMALYSKYLHQKNREKVEKQLNLVKKSLLDHLIPQEPVAAFARMDSELLARYNRCLRDYPDMLRELLHHMETGEPLGERFAPVFG